ncbi:MAG: hypothetical protein OEV91_01715, partial [Desulfobulbaceae bacterium]|nr:hypothetical protein [Desulfobulbaceae bacterium]
VHRLLQALPAAELVVVGPPHLPQIFHGLERVRWEELPYDRNCSFLDRFTVWETLRQLLRREEEGIAPGSLLLVDPDSRLSQLGLLPLLAEESTCYFPSRLNPRPGKNPSLVELVNGWLDGVIGAAGFQSPTVSLPAANIEAAAVFVDKLRASGCRFLIVVNFGVGGDDNKRLGDPFETDLVAALLHGSEDTVILLDSGCACEEKERVLGQLDLYRSQGVATDFVEEGELAAKTIGFAHGIVGFHGSIGGIGSLIGRADGFFGYDSCCQHLAGAVSTPAVIVFAGAPNPRFAARWCPYDATGRNTVLPVADKDALDGVALASLIDRVAAAFAAIRNKEMNS